LKIDKEKVARMLKKHREENSKTNDIVHDKVSKADDMMAKDGMRAPTGFNDTEMQRVTEQMSEKLTDAISDLDPSAMAIKKQAMQGVIKDALFGNLTKEEFKKRLRTDLEKSRRENSEGITKEVYKGAESMEQQISNEIWEDESVSLDRQLKQRLKANGFDDLEDFDIEKGSGVKNELASRIALAVSLVYLIQSANDGLQLAFDGRGDIFTFATKLGCSVIGILIYLQRK
jgi:hypothetical protein